MRIAGLLRAGTVGVLCLAASSARAGKNDLALLNLCTPVSTFVGAQIPECPWVSRQAGTGLIQSVAPDAAGEVGFRSLMSELGAILAPRVLVPAETLGFSGFQVSGDVAITRISNDKPYWRGLEGVSPLNPTATRPDEWLGTVGVFLRKGLWFPLPAFELGGGVVHLLDSRLVAFQGYAKFALHEGFHDWPLPSFAVRGGLSHLTGTDQVRLTIPSVDLLLSKGFGVLKTVRLEPYAGYSFLFIRARSGRIDATPFCDAYAVRTSSAGQPLGDNCSESQRGTGNDLLANFEFPAQDTISRQRLFAGAKLKLGALFLTVQYELFPPGRSRDQRKANSAKDSSGRQESFSVAAGFDY